MIYDLTVIGAGPAGCATAIRAARLGAPVLLLERGRFPRQKVCGEFVSAESLELLRTLLAPRHQRLIAGAPPIGRARIFLDGAELQAEVSPPAVGVTRFELDQALWEAAGEGGVALRDHCAVHAVNRSGAIFQVSAGREIFESRAVINAAGRWSSLSSPEHRTRAAGERWIGLKAHFYEPNPPRSVDLYFFEGGYCGAQPVAQADGGGVINACAMVRSKVATGLDDVLQLHPALRARSASWEPLMVPVSTSPLVFHDPEPVRDEMIQVGDAATFVDPFVGDGISLAIRSGVLAAECAGAFVRGQCSLQDALDTYATAYEMRLSRVMRASSRLRKMLMWPVALRKPALWFLQRSPRVAKQLVRMTR
ncbi:MAG TPA: NAD(P)/FAD-dependent oxidoreductase [Terriglobales bacterium]